MNPLTAAAIAFVCLGFLILAYQCRSLAVILKPHASLIESLCIREPPLQSQA
jgi:hypothetical protein